MINLILLLILSSAAIAEQKFNALEVKNLDVTETLDVVGKIEVVSTTQSSKPCPVMSEAQRDAISSPATGSCVYNSSTLKLNTYDGSDWQEAGGGGLSQWITATPYEVDDVVIESDKIYICQTAHTSGTFATDLAAVKWSLVGATVNLSSEATGTLPLVRGGTNKDLSGAVGAGKIAYTDADSFELAAAGTSSQVLYGGSSPGFAAPQAGYLNLGGASALYQSLKTPNATGTANGATWVLETGNKNILTNADFEAGTYDNGWTVTGTGTEAVETTNLFSGAQSMGITTSSQTIDLSQSSTLYAANFADGVQCLASVRLKTSHTGAISICAVQAGTVSTTDCVTANADNKWGLYSVPFLCGATSNGISIVGASGTGTTYIDDAYAGAAAIIQNADSSKIAGSSYFAGTTSCGGWTRTSTTVGAFATDADCPGPTVEYSSMGTWATTDVDLPEQTVNNLPPGIYKASFVIGSAQTTGGRAAFAINDGTTTCEASPGGSDITYVGNTIVSCVFNYTAAGNRSFELYGASSANTVTVLNDITTPRISTKFILEYFGNNQVYNAQCGANCVDLATAKVSSAEVVSAENVDFINGNCSYSSGDHTCTFNSGYTVAPNCVASVGAHSGGIANITSVSTSTVVVRTKDASGVDQQYGFTLAWQKQGADFTATRLIQGTFKGLPNFVGYSRPKMCNVAFAGASETTACTSTPCTEYVDTCGTVSGIARASTGIYTPTWGAGTFGNNSYLTCGYTSSIRGVPLGQAKADASGGVANVSLYTVNSAFTATDGYGSIWCIGEAP